MKLTIFTPSYNRRELLKNLYLSIVTNVSRLSNDDCVEWLIVDDGSTQDYSKIISSFISTERLAITYFKKQNGGKHTAFNYAIEKCNGDLFVCVDDDDSLLPLAINQFFYYGRLYQNTNYGAFVGRVVDEKGSLLGKSLKNETIVSNTLEIRDKYKYWGEPEIYFVSKLKQFRFSVFNQEKFLTEAFLFDDMSIKYPFVYLQKPFMVKKYLPGGLTDNQLKIRIESPVGTTNYYLKRQKQCKGLANIKARINKIRFNFWVTDNVVFKISFFDVLLFPIAFIFYLHDKVKYKKNK